MFKLFAGFFLGISTLFSGVTHSTAALISYVAGNSSTTTTQQVILTQDQLLAMAGNPYADGNLPLGDKKYVTDAPKKGYIYLCNVQNINGGGAQVAGPWIHGNTWNIKEKIAVTGSVNWHSYFSDTENGDTRTISGNDLPTHSTGIFPIQSTDPASQYDRNPNSIKTQSFSDSLPVNPTYSDTPSCMGGEVGVMTTGVALFNGFDAEYRDAPAYEVQDSCDGHPEKTGEYHYHSLSSCITDTSVSTVIGFALDGFPITGPKVADNKYLTTDNLDECHGITSTINLDGKQVTMYHYVMTQDFPYSVSCFRGKPVKLQLIGNGPSGQQGQGNMPNQQISGTPQQVGIHNMQKPGGQMQMQPPQAAFTACSGKNTGESCSFTGQKNIITGTCKTPPNQNSLVCVPALPQAQGQGAPQVINY